MRRLLIEPLTITVHRRSLAMAEALTHDRDAGIIAQDTDTQAMAAFVGATLQGMSQQAGGGRCARVLPALRFSPMAADSEPLRLTDWSHAEAPLAGRPDRLGADSPPGFVSVLGVDFLGQCGQVRQCDGRGPLDRAGNWHCGSSVRGREHGFHHFECVER